MEKGTSAEKTLIQNAIEQNEEVELKPILNILQRTGAMQATREVAHRQALLAIQSIELLESSVYKEVLIQLASQLLMRSA
jgi:octaprenyl-diphosphate synthase